MDKNTLDVKRPWNWKVFLDLVDSCERPAQEAYFG